MISRFSVHALAGIASLNLLVTCDRRPSPQPSASDIPMDADGIAGTVTSSAGPEAGARVVAETVDLHMQFARNVVTDDDGRYLVLDLPCEEEVAGFASELNYYLTWIKNMGCVGCLHDGQRAHAHASPGLCGHRRSPGSLGAAHGSGQAGFNMTRIAGKVLQGLPIRYFANWSERIAASELPAEKSERPGGVERHVVATVRDWSSPQFCMHDLNGTDRRDPIVNGYGPIYGAPELSTDEMPIHDPLANTASVFKLPVRDKNTPTSHDDPVVAPSPYWGDERIWDSHTNVHNPVLDQDGRVWLTARIRAPDNPDFCKAGSSHPSAALHPKDSAGRHLALLEPKTGHYTFVDTCFGTHHLQFAYDERHTLWTSGGGEVVGWIDTTTFLASHEKNLRSVIAFHRCVNIAFLISSAMGLLVAELTAPKLHNSCILTNYCDLGL